MNLNRARASAIKHSMQMSAAMSSDNPYHGQHIQQFCEYADAVAEDVKKDIPDAVKDEVHKQLSGRKVEIEIDKQSLKKAQKAMDDLFAPLKKWFK